MMMYHGSPPTKTHGTPIAGSCPFSTAEMLSLSSDTIVLYSVHVACFHVNPSLTCFPSCAYWNSIEAQYIARLLLKYMKVKSWEEGLM